MQKYGTGDAWVEIDTLWNVKAGKSAKKHIPSSRNRYIVECKGASRARKLAVCSE